MEGPALNGSCGKISLSPNYLDNLDSGGSRSPDRTLRRAFPVDSEFIPKI